MGDYWINWRFGIRHLKVGRMVGGFYVTLTVNPYHIKSKPSKWFERY